MQDDGTVEPMLGGMGEEVVENRQSQEENVYDEHQKKQLFLKLFFSPFNFDIILATVVCVKVLDLPAIASSWFFVTAVAQRQTE